MSTTNHKVRSQPATILPKELNMLLKVTHLEVVFLDMCSHHPLWNARRQDHKQEGFWVLRRNLEPFNSFPSCFHESLKFI